MSSDALCRAAADGDLAAVGHLSADPAQRRCTLPTGGAVPGDDRLSALMLASLFGHLDVVRHLVDAGFDPLDRDPEGRSAYVLAAAGNHGDIVDFFWERGVRPPADDPHIGTVLWSAGLTNRKAILEHYLSRGAKVDAAHFGYTALVAAAQSGHLELVTWLIEKGARSREKALEEATAHGRGEVVDYLRSLE